MTRRRGLTPGKIHPLVVSASRDNEETANRVFVALATRAIAVRASPLEDSGMNILPFGGLRALALLWLFWLVAATLALEPGCGSRVTRCAPVPNSDTCKDLSMSPSQGETVDAWFQAGDAISVPSERCAYWRKRLPDARTLGGGLCDFVEHMEADECSKAARPPKIEPAKSDAGRLEAGGPAGTPGDASAE